MSFSEFQLHPDLLRGVESLGFQAPTAIQRDAIPPAMAGRDVLACAVTGSGKTAAFLLPILQKLIGLPRGTTRALIIAPTRELAAQIDEHRGQLARHTRVSGAAIFGGVGMGPQESALRRGVDIIVATPGRLLDHMRMPYTRLDGLQVLVLDEADRMLDMGFLPDIQRILKQLPARRQTLLLSATMPGPIAALAKQILHDPVAIQIERPSAPAVGITHTVYQVPQELKSALLVELLKQPGTRSVLAFTRTKHRANRLADYLARHGVKADRIHGNRSQAQRTQALAGFKDGRFQVLVATDIAARGIDIDALSHVVNFDVPGMPDEYIHRVGRTARAEAVGDALTLVSPDEEGDLRGIERAVGSRFTRAQLPGFDYTKRPADKLEIPLAERIAQIRARKAEDRQRARANAERRAAHGTRPAQLTRGR
ncbi:MAG TPA: DEAD/DEAH box helicase [Methylomirabilota bacterium]|nr:DEAD/DEAH box helicase [Methylomirabilota bacterium]